MILSSFVLEADILITRPGPRSVCHCILQLSSGAHTAICRSVYRWCDLLTN